MYLAGPVRILNNNGRRRRPLNCRVVGRPIAITTISTVGAARFSIVFDRPTDQPSNPALAVSVHSRSAVGRPLNCCVVGRPIEITTISTIGAARFSIRLDRPTSPWLFQFIVGRPSAAAFELRSLAGAVCDKIPVPVPPVFHRKIPVPVEKTHTGTALVRVRVGLW